ncbi:hypothetical protein QL285_063085 [Trifolium repens]|nr:hypothetical protein QL285_063085 [Trifolium repens]
MVHEEFPPIATFFMIRLGVQGYAEIEPSFVTAHFNTLKTFWIIKQANGSYATLKFNKSYENPLICMGWRQFAEALQLPNNVELKFAYYGKNVFLLLNFRPIQIQSEINPFHSRSLFPLLT